MADEILIRFSVKDDGSPVIEKVNKKIGETKLETMPTSSIKHYRFI